MSHPLWTLKEILAATSGTCDVKDVAHIQGVSIDTRTLQPQDLFVAIKGDVHDGHKFVSTAFEKGATCALVSKDYQADGTTGPLIRVDDPLKAMEALGVAARKRTNAKIIAITGSVGKTSTKEALRLCLSEQGKTHASEKSYNNHWGVPLTLARMPRETEFGVFEIGMNHPGEITVLTGFVHPHIAIVTTVEAVHLGFFKSVEDIAEAKAEIFLGFQKGGKAILNADNPHFELLKIRAEANYGEVYRFGQPFHLEAGVKNLTLCPDHSEVHAMIAGEDIKFTLGVPGQHLVMNALAVLLAVKLAGADVHKAAACLAHQTAPKGRGERTIFNISGGQVALIDESYNANPASMTAALLAMAQTPRTQFPRRIAVLGDMLELGEFSKQLHEELRDPLEQSGTDLVFACGPLMSHLFELLPETQKGGYAKTSEDLKPLLFGAVRAGDIIMVKGSLGSKMGPLVEALKDRLYSAQ